MYKYYVEMGPKHNGETYEIVLPTISAHNLIIGKPYLDLGGESTIKNMQRPGEICKLEFHKRGWSESTYYKVDGEIFKNGGGKKDQAIYKIDAKWNKSATLTNCATGVSEVTWTKREYPKDAELMYGMSHFMLQLNYLPKQLEAVIAPTDTRYRPD
jgi:CRISPR/Cas system CMR-associated protein Cmr3 (group 5 of RAMP superfamily)